MHSTAISVDCVATSQKGGDVLTRIANQNVPTTFADMLPVGTGVLGNGRLHHGEFETGESDRAVVLLAAAL